jgi:hypothetical protein
MGRQPLGEQVLGGSEAAVAVQIPAQCRIADVGHEHRAGVGRFPADDVIEGARGVLDRAHGVEIRRARIELAEIAEDLDETDRQRDRLVIPLFIDHLCVKACRTARTSERDDSRVGGPGLCEGWLRGGCQRARDRQKDGSLKWLHVFLSY